MATLPAAPCAPSVQQTMFDVRNVVDCQQMLSNMLMAYYSVIGGTRPVTVRFKERWVEYSKATQNDLVTAYMQLYRQCPMAAVAGLPDLNPQKRVRRGPPMIGMQTFPRM